MAENSTHDPLQSKTSGKVKAPQDPQKLIPVDPRAENWELLYPSSDCTDPNSGNIQGTPSCRTDHREQAKDPTEERFLLQLWCLNPFKKLERSGK